MGELFLVGFSIACSVFALWLYRAGKGDSVARGGAVVMFAGIVLWSIGSLQFGSRSTGHQELLVGVALFVAGSATAARRVIRSAAKRAE